MPKPLSQQLSDLAVHAKKAEDAIAAAQKESHHKVMARREQTRAAAAAPSDKPNPTTANSRSVIAALPQTIGILIRADRAREDHDGANVRGYAGCATGGDGGRGWRRPFKIAPMNVKRTIV